MEVNNFLVKHSLNWEIVLSSCLSQGRPINDIEHYGCPPWPDMQDLINHCLQFVSRLRPSAQEVFDRLCSAEFVSLKRAIPVGHDRSVETFAIRVRTTPFPC